MIFFGNATLTSGTTKTVQGILATTSGTNVGKLIFQGKKIRHLLIQLDIRNTPTAVISIRPTNVNVDGAGNIWLNSTHPVFVLDTPIDGSNLSDLTIDNQSGVDGGVTVLVIFD